MSRFTVALAVSLSLSLSLSLLAPAHAGGAGAATGHVALASAPLGSGADAALRKRVRRASHGRAVFQEKAGAWKVHYAVALAHRLPSAEFTLRIFDVTSGKRFIGSRDKMVFDDRPVVGGSFSLARDEVFAPNARLLLEIDSAGVLVARRTFYIQGKVTRSTGEVAFSADEATGADEAAGVERGSFVGKKRRH